MAHWTSQYFGKLYHDIYSTHLLEPQRALDEAAFASHVLDLGRRSVLDVACGYGRHSRLIASSNRVYALDNNCEYLSEIKQGLSERVALNIVPLCADMRDMPLGDKSVDAAIMLFNSFGYFDTVVADSATTPAQDSNAQVWRLPNVFYERQLVDPAFGKFRDPAPKNTVVSDSTVSSAADPQTSGNYRVLKEVLRVLKPGGGFLLELPNPRPLLEAVEENPRRLMVMEDCEVHEEFEWDAASKSLGNRTRFVRGDKEEAALYSIRLYDPAEIKALARDAGFIVRRMYGDYEGDRFRPAASDILLLHLSRPAR